MYRFKLSFYSGESPETGEYRLQCTWPLYFVDGPLNSSIIEPGVADITIPERQLLDDLSVIADQLSRSTLQSHFNLRKECQTFIDAAYDDGFFDITGGDATFESADVAPIGHAQLLTKALPGMLEQVRHPVDGHIDRLYNVVLSLNDQCKWSREAIADWLETLDIDIAFPSV